MLAIFLKCILKMLLICFPVLTIVNIDLYFLGFLFYLYEIRIGLKFSSSVLFSFQLSADIYIQ